MTDTLGPIRQLLYGIKWAIICFVFVVAWRVDFTTIMVERVPILVAVSVIAALTLAGQIARSRIASWLMQPVFSLAADIVLVTVVVYFSDGIQSPFYPLYYIAVITAAVDYGLTGALVSAALLATISVPVDAISPATEMAKSTVMRDALRTIPYLFITALITGALRSRLHVVDEAASELRAQQAATDREMEIAARIQRALLPIQTPSIAGLRVAVTYRPAREVGGDLYDFYPVDDDCLGLIAADVSGKGVPAALLVSTCKYSVRESYSQDLRHMMDEVNRHVLTVTTADTFVTMVYGVLQLRDREFRYVNAGHMPPMVVRADGSVECPELSDPPLGVAEFTLYTPRSVQLQPGDTLVLYTDGVTDALGEHGLAIDALKDFLADVAGSDVAGWEEELMQRIGVPAHLDDMTLVAVRIDDI